MKSLLSLASVVLALPLVAQSNAIPGADVSVYDVGGPNSYGREGAPYPNGTAGIVIGHSMSNCGTVHIPWQGNVGSTMVDNHVRIAFVLARESGGRIVQISGKSFLKHSRIAFNFSGAPPCFPCQTGPANHFRIGCYDIYSAGFNGSQFHLGPSTEINPWLGTWEPLGSYFDIGDPSQAGYPAVADSVQSLDTSGFGPVKNRMAVPEQELVVAGNFYGQNQVSIKGEPVANRDNNQVSRPMAFNWNGSSWTVQVLGASQQGSVLSRWSGATLNYGGNGMDDGRFLVAVKVTGPTNGMWHYEYAVQNVDNDRGGASFRIPVCDNARVENIGFRDIDQNPLNEWTTTRQGGELQYLASANNPLDWNTFYNFYFDSDAAPVAGDVSLDQARLGPGALTVNVPTTVPGLLGTEYLGAGCGGSTTIEANGVPSSPNPAYGIDVAGGSGNFVVVAFAGATANLPVGGGCNLWVDKSQLIVSDLLQLNGAGTLNYSVPDPAGLSPIDLSVQVAELFSGGPLLGLGGLSNGLKIRAAGTGCQ